MKDREGQRSGPNPEWEINKEQNIATANRIKGLLQVEKPNKAEIFKALIKAGLENLEELNLIKNIEFLKEVGGLIDERGRPAVPREIQEELTNDDIEQLTLGYTHFFSHVDNKHRRLVLGVGLCDEAKNSDFLIGSMIGGLPEDFAYPVYVIQESEPTDTVPDNDYKVLQSTKYGKLPSDIVGANGLFYEVENVYCFNLFGQGTRIERIHEIDIGGEILDTLGEPFRKGFAEKTAYKWLEEVEEKERKSLHVDFIPEEGYRAMPLTTDDYQKINEMFQDIDVGLYQYPVI